MKTRSRSDRRKRRGRSRKRMGKRSPQREDRPMLVCTGVVCSGQTRFTQASPPAANDPRAHQHGSIFPLRAPFAHPLAASASAFAPVTSGTRLFRRSASCHSGLPGGAGQSGPRQARKARNERQQADSPEHSGQTRFTQASPPAANDPRANQHRSIFPLLPVSLGMAHPTTETHPYRMRVVFPRTVPVGVPTLSCRRRSSGRRVFLPCVRRFSLCRPLVAR